MSSSDSCLSGAICLALTPVYLELYISSSDYCLSGAIYV